MTLKRIDTVLIVVDDLEAGKASFIELGLKLEGGAELIGEMQYEHVPAELAYIRGPEGIIVALAEQLS